MPCLYVAFKIVHLFVVILIFKAVRNYFCHSVVLHQLIWCAVVCKTVVVRHCIHVLTVFCVLDSARYIMGACKNGICHELVIYTFV